MSLPRITSSTSPTSVTESEGSPIFKVHEKRTGMMHGREGSPSQPRFMTGYGGHQPQLEQEEETPRIIHAPVVGYTGSYRGKNIGKLGRCEVHRTRLSVWEKDTVSGILGVPAAQDDWEYSHYINSCSNFSAKQFNESTNRSPGATSSCSTSGGLVGMEGSSMGSAASFGRLATASPVAGTTSTSSETDRILMQVQMALESRFKTATLARSTLKSAYFAADRGRSGQVPTEVFFDILRRVGGAALTPSQQAHLAVALHHAGRGRGNATASSAQAGAGDYALGSARLEEDGEGEELGGAGYENSQGYGGVDAEIVTEICYGRFLNVVVPRSPKKGLTSSPH